MTDKKITDEAAAGALNGADVLGLIQSGADTQTTLTAVANYINGLLGSASTKTADTDGTLAANSNSNVPTQQAVKTAIAAAVAGLSWKQAVRAATTANGALATAYANGQIIDGVTLATGDRILLKNQTAGAENGIYVVPASGAPARATDADSGAKLVNASVYVSEGTTLADTQWTCTTDATITVGTTALVFAQASAGSVAIGSVTGMASGAATFLTTATSANLAALVTDETGTGALVLATSPTLVTPVLGTPTSVTLTNATGLPLTTGVTGLLPVANGGSGTATPAIVAGSNITVSGTWPNQTINASAPGTGTVTSVSVTSANGVSGSVATATTTPAITLTLAAITPTTVTPTAAINEAPAVTIASSTTPAIFAAAANTINLTGTTTVAGFDTIAAGAVRRVIFAGALVLTYNATSMQNLTSANITTAAGDVAEFESLGSGNTKMLSYTRADGTALVGSGASPTTTKGDLIVRSSTADSRLAVGANGQTPIADSTQTLGIRWGTPAGGLTVGVVLDIFNLPTLL